MRLTLTDDQEFFRVTIRKFLDAEAPLTTVRSLYDSPSGFDRGWWGRAAELGWTSMFVAEAAGGGSLSGRPATDAVIVAEEIGRVVAPGPFLPVSVVAAALSRAGSGDHVADLLPGLLSGDAIATWAFAERPGQWRPEALRTEIRADGADVVVTGEKAFVEALASSSHALVTGVSTGGLSQVLVPLDTAGVELRPGRSVDMTRRFGSLVLRDVRLPASALVGELGESNGAVDHQLRLAIALQCAELVGLADRTLEMTLDYGRDRFAFGRPILSFQALKHRVADMFQWLESSKAVSDELASMIDDDDPATDQMASVAKAYVGDYAARIVDECVQITGGIGVTWEHDIHLYNRRAVLDRALYGSPEEHRDRVFDLLVAEHEGNAG